MNLNEQLEECVRHEQFSEKIAHPKMLHTGIHSGLTGLDLLLGQEHR